MRGLVFYLCLVVAISSSAQDTLRPIKDSVAYIKLRKGVATFKKTIPPEDVRVYISVKMQTEKDGNYQITYRPGTTTAYELKKQKWVTPGAAVAEVIGGLVVLTLTILSIASHF